jgi:DNA gyrase subunit A
MDIGTIQPVDIDHQMRTAYLDYAMSVIVARALPDARDGLKPVQRRILYAMSDLGVRANSGYKKSARIVGEVLGKYHPHGDMAVYDAMARLAQDFSLRYPLVDGQGNFGSVDGDPPAAPRYTEARMSAMAEELLADIDRNTVNFGDNFDSSLQEPLVLPGRAPNMLLNGATGIAVGMATSIPPHNLREVAAAANHLIEHWNELDEITNDELMQFVPGPDFPTGGVIVGREAIRQGYNTGRSRLTVRGLARIEELKNGRQVIYITEIPYLVNKSTLIQRIAELVREGRIEDISDLRDESDRTGMSIVIELKRNAHARKVLNQLYKWTALESTFSVQMLALVEGEPRLLSLKRALQIYIEHRQEVITRRIQFDLDKARARAHILQGLLIALSNLDAVIQTIRQAPDVETARANLVARFNLSELQAQAILEMQLRRLAALERKKIEDEHLEMVGRIAHFEELLADPKKILALIQTDLRELAEKYGDDRRTRITAEEKEQFKEEDLVRDEAVLVSFTQRGYIKRTPVTAFKAMNRGRRGVSGQTMRDEDEVVMLIPARSLQTILFFSDRGKVYAEKAFQIPEAGRTDKGLPIVNVLALDPGERITAAVSVPDFEQTSYCIMATVQGRIKRVLSREFANVRPSGMIAMGLDEGDFLAWARLTGGKDDILLVTAGGQALRFHESAVRAQGRQGGGVAGIRLEPGDKVVSMDVTEAGGALMVITEQGYGKRAPLENYPVKSRATGGVATADLKSMDRTGKISVARVVQEGDEVMVISSSGSVLRLKAAVISLMGRASRGLRVMDVVKGDMVASLARIPYEDLGQTTREPEAVVDSVESKEVVEPEPDPDLDFDGEPEA